MMNFDEIYEYLYNGYACVLDHGTLVYMGEDDDTFYLDLDDRRLVFSEENNPRPLELQENGFFLIADDGERYLIQRLKLG